MDGVVGVFLAIGAGEAAAGGGGRWQSGSFEPLFINLSDWTDMSVPGAENVRKGHELDTAALEAYLRRNIPSFGACIAVLLQFKSGQSNPTYYIKDDLNSEYVLRKKPSGQILPSAVRS